MSQQVFRVRNDLAEVERLNNEMAGLWAREGLPADSEMDVTLALEEVVSNVIRHGCTPGREYDIQVHFQAADGAVEVEVTDDAMAFDPLSLPPPNLDVPIEQRKAGGLGVFLVRELMDEVSYQRVDGRNHFKFRKLL